ncbi:MAG: restriction endonuclease subunit S [Endomicrobium sp.]|jgi:restriction endonuclease S subunit|nr:restriction endonuclease subunit S [Endomicrobium sp.]
MKTLALQEICTDIFAGATIFTNNTLSRDYKNDGFRVIRLADIQNNEISFKDCLYYNKQDYKKNRYLLQDNDILISSRGTIFKVAIFSKEDNQKTIPSGFLTCIRLKPELNMSAHYVAAYLRHIENDIISGKKQIKKNKQAKAQIKLTLTDIYNIEIPMLATKVQKEIDKLSKEATAYLKKNISKTQEIEEMLSDINSVEG